MNLIAENTAGIRAREHLDYLQPFFDAIRADLNKQWMATKPHEVVKRENFWRQLHCLTTLEAKLRAVIETGHMAGMAIQRERNINGRY